MTPEEAVLRKVVRRMLEEPRVQAATTRTVMVMAFRHEHAVN